MITEYRLSILGRATFVTAPKVAVRETMEEEEAAQKDEKRGGG